MLNIVIVVGCQRSGTTLTGQILGAHPNTILIDENDGLYPWIAQLLANSNDKSTHFSNSLFSELISKSDGKYVDDQKKTKKSENEAQLKSNISHIILKAPNLTYSFESLANSGLPVSVIYPVRDVRSVVASMMKLSEIPFVDNQIRWLEKIPELADRFCVELDSLKSENLSTPIKQALVWKIKSHLQEEYKSRDIPIYSFNYESLILTPREIVLKLAKHSGLSFHENMLCHNTIYKGLGPGGTQRFRAIDPDSLELWRNCLAPTLADEIVEITANG